MRVGAYEFENRQGCPVCLSIEGRSLFKASFSDNTIATYLRTFYSDQIDPGSLAEEDYELIQCLDCELVYQRNILDPAGLKELYDGIASSSLQATQRKRGLADRRKYSFQVEQAIKFVGKSPSCIEVLDFGSGWGLWLDMAAAYGCQTSAVELSVARSGSRSMSRHKLFGLLELPGEQFHYVNADQVFEHLADPAAALKHLVMALLPGGLIRLSVPNGSQIPDLLKAPDWAAAKGSRRSLNAVAPLEHINCFNHNALMALTEEVGDLTPFGIHQVNLLTDLNVFASWPPESHSRYGSHGEHRYFFKRLPKLLVVLDRIEQPSERAES